MWRPSCSHFTHCAPRFDSEPPESRAAAGRAGVSMTSRGRRRARTLRRCRPRVTRPTYAQTTRGDTSPLLPRPTACTPTGTHRHPLAPTPPKTIREMFVSNGAHACPSIIAAAQTVLHPTMAARHLRGVISRQFVLP